MLSDCEMPKIENTTYFGVRIKNRPVPNPSPHRRPIKIAKEKPVNIKFSVRKIKLDMARLGKTHLTQPQLVSGSIIRAAD